MRTSSGKFQKMRIRTAQASDADRITALSGQLGYPSSCASVRRRLRNLLGDHAHAVWVAEAEGGDVAGWIHVFIKQVLESDREAEIGGLVIDKEFRGRGMGKALVERAERWARTRSLKSVYVRSNVVRKDAHPFYEKLGYSTVKTQYAFRKPL